LDFANKKAAGCRRRWPGKSRALHFMYHHSSLSVFEYKKPTDVFQSDDEEQKYCCQEMVEKKLSFDFQKHLNISSCAI